MKIRINKFLAHSGLCSRREAEKLIEKGSIKVNGSIIIEQGVKINPDKDKIEINQQHLAAKEKEKVVFALNKPKGFVCSTHKTKVEKDIITDLFPADCPRLFSVGRLDKETSGLLLVTNNGAITFRLTHPKFGHSKKYLVETFTAISNTALDKIKKGVNLFGQKTLPTEIKRISNNKFYLILKEGKNRQIRRICRKVGSNVKNLTRIQIGQLTLKELKIKTGEFKKLSSIEIEKALSND